jgi:hypothetical protein
MASVQHHDLHSLHRYYRKLGANGQDAEKKRIHRLLPGHQSQCVEFVELEYVYNVEIVGDELNQSDKEILLWLITETFEPDLVAERSFHQPASRRYAPSNHLRQLVVL